MKEFACGLHRNAHFQDGEVKFVIRCSQYPYMSVNQGAGVKRKIPCHYLSMLPVLPAPKPTAGDVRLVLLLGQGEQVSKAEQGTLLTPAHLIQLLDL